MRRLSLIIPALVIVLLGACQGPPPTQIVIVVTATPNGIAEPNNHTSETTEEPAETEEALPSPTRQQNDPTSTPAGTPTATPVINQIQVAEQVFQNGRMFWIQPTQQIWVMVVTGEGQGEWVVYEDTYTDGEAEVDPQLTPPDGMEQPRRGFGKLWRENPDMKEALGWAITPEFGYVTRYEYYCDEQIVENEQTRCELGYHVLTSLYEEAFRFNEVDSTWQLN